MANRNAVDVVGWLGTSGYRTIIASEQGWKSDMDNNPKPDAYPGDAKFNEWAAKLVDHDSIECIDVYGETYLRSRNFATNRNDMAVFLKVLSERKDWATYTYWDGKHNSQRNHFVGVEERIFEHLDMGHRRTSLLLLYNDDLHPDLCRAIWAATTELREDIK